MRIIWNGCQLGGGITIGWGLNCKNLKPWSIPDSEQNLGGRFFKSWMLE